MKKLVFASLGALVLASTGFCFAASVSANETIPVETIAVRKSSRITPYNLVSRGYQGAFKSQGIPSASVFRRKAQSGKITAVELIQAGITSGRLSQSVIDDRSYVQAVNNILKRMLRN